MRKVILTDTGYWLGLVDPTDQYHSASTEIAEVINNETVIIPWPCLYETLSTRLTRNRNRLLNFKEIITKPNIVLLEDVIYKELAFKLVFSLGNAGKAISLTDVVIREILKDDNVNINYFITFNKSDFKDVCDLRSIDLL